MLKLLDGNKRLLVVLGFTISSFVALLTGQDVSQWLDLALRAMGWTDPTTINDAKMLATEIAPLLFAVWAAVHALWKMWEQHKAGATVAQINSPIGVVKAAIADDMLKVQSASPVTLVMAAEPLVAEEAASTVSLRVQPIPPAPLPSTKVEVG